MEHDWRFDFDNGSLPCATPYMVLDDRNSTSNQHPPTLPRSSSLHSFGTLSDLDNPEPSTVDHLIAGVTDDKPNPAQLHHHPHHPAKIEKCTPDRFQLKLSSPVAPSNNPAAFISSIVSEHDYPRRKKRTCSTLERFDEESPPLKAPHTEDSQSPNPQQIWHPKPLCDRPAQENSNSCSDGKTCPYDLSEPSNGLTNECSTPDSHWKTPEPSLLQNNVDTSIPPHVSSFDLEEEPNAPFVHNFDTSQLAFKLPENNEVIENLPSNSTASPEPNPAPAPSDPLTEKDALQNVTFVNSFVSPEAVDTFFERAALESEELTLPSCDIRPSHPEDNQKPLDALAEKNFPQQLDCDDLDDPFPDCAASISPQEFNLVMNATTDSSALPNGPPPPYAIAVPPIGTQSFAGGKNLTPTRADAKALRKKRKKTTKREAAKAASAAERRRTNEIVRLAKEKLISDEDILKLKPKKVRRAARFEQAIPSRFCHICSRTPKSAILVPCRRLGEGTCRKVACDKCFAEYRLGDFEAAKDVQNSEWECTHCTGTCPDRAQCTTYQRINDRLRANRLKQDKPKGRKGKRKEKKEWEEEVKLEVVSPIESENARFGFGERFVGADWQTQPHLEF